MMMKMEDPEQMNPMLATGGNNSENEQNSAKNKAKPSSCIGPSIAQV
jgi:hypothetical protein